MLIGNFTTGNFGQILLPFLDGLFAWGKTWLQKIAKPGMYIVLNYETTLELLDVEGKNAVLSKIEEVKFLQNNIIAFQDQAWGDGEILLDYQCSPGKAVDFFRNGHKTLVLISLPYMKQKGEYTTFRISWKIKKGFLKPNGFWGTDIDHQTEKVKVNLIFPVLRPPKRVYVEEINTKKLKELDRDNIAKLPDGRWEISWEKQNPRIHEHYIMRWEW